MREKHDFELRRKGRHLSPDRLIKILRQTDMRERADETYKNLTGLNPPPEDGEIIVEEKEETNG